MDTKYEISTQGITYAGSKKRLLPYIHDIIDPLNIKSVFDGFSGTTRVSQMLAQQGFNVICNDISIWSEVFGKCYLLASSPAEYQKMISHLNETKPEDGWFTENYGGTSDTKYSLQADGKKKLWQVHNTKKLDGIRQEIDRMGLTDIEKSVCLTSLILALDKVENSIGHYSSYLRKWSPRSYSKLWLEVPQICDNTNSSHSVFRENTACLAKNIEADLAYYDPPYGSNNTKMPASRVRYGGYYHIWKTVILNDRPDLFGKAARREDSSDKISASKFENFHKSENGEYVAAQAIRELTEATATKYILFSYSSGGRVPVEDIVEILSENRKILQVEEIDVAKNVMSAMSWTEEWSSTSSKNYEYLILSEK